ncbi:hypothetical protein KA005_44915 [bacterium]|nr:hypothetical protein [bacterium]
MATSMVSVPEKIWKLISTVSIKFQIPEQSSALAVEALVIPTDTAIRNKINPGTMYTFQKLDGNLYMYSETAIEVAIEPLS